MERQIVEQVLTAKGPVCVVGDIILDQYTWGKALRVSPEAPVPILDVDMEEVRLGGAAAVAMILTGLGVQVELCGVVGNDAVGQTTLRLLDDAGVDREGVVCDPSRPTTHKHRFVGRAAGRHPHQMMRVDHETREPLSTGSLKQVNERAIALASEAHVTVIADYGKGTCHPHVLQSLMSRSDVLVDPAVGADYESYRGASLIKPNRREAELASGQPIHTPDDALVIARQLRDQLGANVVITLDHEGVVVQDADYQAHIAALVKEVYDVTGAGDTAIAMLAMGTIAGLSLQQSGELVNAAAGIQIGRMGVSPISAQDLLTACVTTTPASQKVACLETAMQKCDEWRAQQQHIVFTNGCFDMLHIGHVRMLQEAAAMGDRLIVAVNSDPSVRALKGPARPVISDEHRAELLAALECIDLVMVFDDATPERLLKCLRPDILVKGGTTGAIVGSEIVESYGGRVFRTSSTPRISTTTLLERARSQSCADGHS